MGKVAADDSSTKRQPINPAPSAENGQMTDETPQHWFVQLTAPPLIEGGKASVLNQEVATFRFEAAKAGLVYHERFVFNDLYNGLSIEIAPAQIAKLRRIQGITAIYPVVSIPIPETNALNDPEQATALAMTDADIVQSELGDTGAGVRVAVMDQILWPPARPGPEAGHWETWTSPVITIARP